MLMPKLAAMVSNTHEAWMVTIPEDRVLVATSEKETQLLSKLDRAHASYVAYLEYLAVKPFITPDPKKFKVYRLSGKLNVYALIPETTYRFKDLSEAEIVAGYTEIAKRLEFGGGTPASPSTVTTIAMSAAIEASTTAILMGFFGNLSETLTKMGAVIEPIKNQAMGGRSEIHLSVGAIVDERDGYQLIT